MKNNEGPVHIMGSLRRYACIKEKAFNFLCTSEIVGQLLFGVLYLPTYPQNLD